MSILPGDGENIITDEAVYFYTPRYYVFANFSAYTVTLWGKTFPTAEHAYQWKKFSDISPEIAQEIAVSLSPYAVKKISDAHKDLVPEVWHKLKEAVMEEILRTKLAQHQNALDKLKETNQKMIYENSPTDSYWGIGEDGSGKNILGELWMRLRSELI